MIEGLEKHLEKSWSTVLAGKKYTRTEVVALLQRRVDGVNAVMAAKASWQVARGQDGEVNAETADAVLALRQTLLAMFGKSPDVLAALGLSPRRARKALTGQEIVQKAERAKATRQARHTLGTRQRQAIHGGADDAPPAIAPPVAPAPVVNGAGSGANGATAPSAGGS
jgi:hypothetical protein